MIDQTNHQWYNAPRKGVCPILQTTWEFDVMLRQQELDFTGKRVARRAHFRTTTLTINWDSFRRLKEMDADVPYSVEFVNDIVSSCKNSGNSEDHHAIRRRDLLARQFKGGYRQVNVRPAQGITLGCLMVDLPVGNSDACSCVIRVCKPKKEEEG